MLERTMRLTAGVNCMHAHRHIVWRRFTSESDWAGLKKI